MKIKVIPYNTLEYASLDAFPATGESGKHYLALDTMLLYTWSSIASQYSRADFRYEGRPAYHGSYLKSGYLEFTMVASPTLIDWHNGDYIRYDRTGRIYKLYGTPQVERQASTNHSGESFAYRNVQFYDKTKDLSLVPFRDLVPGAGGAQYYFSSKQDVAFTGTVANVVERLNANLANFFGTGVWNVRIADNIPEFFEVSIAKDFSVSGMCQDALNAIYETWHELGWAYAIENGVDTIIIGYPNIAPATSGNRTNIFSYDNGLTALKRNNGSMDNFCTRMHVYGTERNLINRYYNGKDIYNAGSVNIQNLMIPIELWGQTSSKPDANKAFIEDADKIEQYGLITKDVYFDGTDGRPEIYPSIEQQTIEILKAAKTSLGKTGAGAPDYYPQEEDDTIRVDQVKAAVQMPQDEGTPTNSGERYIDTYDAAINATIVNAQSVSNRQSREVQLFEYTFVDNGVVDIRWNGALRCVLDQALAAGDYITLRLCVYKGSVSRNTMVSSADFKVESDITNGQILNLDSVLSIGSKTEQVTGRFVVTLQYAIISEGSGTRTITITKEGDILASANIREALVANFKIKTHQIGFDIAKMQSSGGAVIAVKSGMCAGREFSIVKAIYNSEDDDWTLTCKRSQDTSTQTYYPNATFAIAADDEFVILGITMPEEYILAQAHRLYTLGQELFDRVSVFRPTFEPSIDSKKVLENITAHPSDEQYKLVEGKYMRLYDEDLIADDHNTDVMISEITINEGEAEIATYHVVLSDKANVTGGLSRTVANISTEVENIQKAQRAQVRSQELGSQASSPAMINGGTNVTPVYIKDGMPQPIDGLDVENDVLARHNVQALWGVSAYGMATLGFTPVAGGGTLTKIKINGTPLTDVSGVVNIPLATTEADGAMSAADKTKLNTIAPYADANLIEKIYVNSVEQTITNKAVYLSVPTALSQLTDDATHRLVTDTLIGRWNGVYNVVPAAAYNQGNELADKAFVNSSVATATATFRGTNTTATTESAFLVWANGLTHDLNDYVFWQTTDSVGNVVYKRYKYDGTQWVFEYDLNNSSFTADQWAAINSGITGTLVTSYSNHIANTSNPHGVTKAQVGLGNVENTALSTWAGTSYITTLGTITTGKWQGTAIADTYIASASTWNAKYAKPTGGIPDTDMTTAVQTALSNANTAFGWGDHAQAGYALAADLGTAATHAHGDYVTAITYDSTNRKLQQSKGGGTATDIVTFGSNAFNSDTYAGGTAVTLNGTSKAKNTASFYAPTSAGTAGQYLKSTGGAPAWEDFATPYLEWSGGTSAGPKLQIFTDGGGSQDLPVPTATAAQSGVVIVGPQTFGGAKSFDSTITAASHIQSTNGNIEALHGGVAAFGIASLMMGGAGGAGTLTKIKINGTPLTDVSGVVNIPLATTQADGAMSSADKSKLDGIEPYANNYTLPVATSDALGGIRIGYGASGKYYAVQLDNNNKAYVYVPWENTTYSNGTGLDLSNGEFSINSTYQTYISNGNTAYEWGNHANAGYFAASSFTQANIQSTLGISDWALAASKPSYAFSEITGTASDSQIPTLAISKISGLQTALDNKLATSLKGAANGLAELDANGLVPSSQLPSYVDDVLEYASKSAFPATGETGKIYVALDTNLTYRWSGSAYVEISPSLALGETSSTAYRGDRGKTAYDHATDASRLTTAQSSGFYKFATTSEGHIASVTAVSASDLTSLIGSTTYAPYNADGYLPLSGGTMTGDLYITPTNSSGDCGMFVSDNTSSLLFGIGNSKNKGIYLFDVGWLVGADPSNNVFLKGNADTATKATNDSDGNAINTTYLKKSGGTMANTNVVTNLNADLLDGTHKTDLFTAFANDNDQLSSTIGGTNKKVTVGYASRSTDTRTELLTEQEFAYRQTGGGTLTKPYSSGVIKRVLGNTLAWNQGVNSLNVSAEVYGITRTINGNALHYSGTSSQTTNYTATSVSPLIIGHKYYLATKGIPSSCNIHFSDIAGTEAVIITADSDWLSFGVKIPQGVTINNDVYCYCIDLTIFFNNNIPEGLTAEAFERDYGYLLANPEYNAGTLINNACSGLESVGFNRWDEEWEVGAYNAQGEPTSAYSNVIRSKNNDPIPVLPSTNYYIYSVHSAGSGGINVFYYDANGNYTGAYSELSNNGGSFTTPSNVRFIKFHVGQTGSVYQHDICINLSDTNRNGQYEPYRKVKTPLNLKEIKVKSHNIWDEEWENNYISFDDGSIIATTNAIMSKNYNICKPSTTYHISCANSALSIYAIGIVFYDSNHNFLQGSWKNNSDIVSPSNACYFKICTQPASGNDKYGGTYNNDISVHISDPAFNGKYEPHGVLTFNGLNRATNYDGSLVSCDEIIDGKKYIKRYGIKYGTQFILHNTSSYNYKTYKIILEDGSAADAQSQKQINNFGIVYNGPLNSGTINYETIQYDSTGGYYYISLNPNRNIQDFVLIYELVTPIEYELVEPLTLEYPIDVLGTERIVSDELVAPFVADIQYGAEQRDIAVDINNLHISTGLLSNRASALESYFTNGIANNAARLSNTSAIGGATKPVYFTANGVPSACSDYAGGTAVTLNGSSKAASTASFYAPTGAGSNGNILQSTGGTPSWVAQSTIVAGKATILETKRTLWGQDFNGSANVTGNMSNVGDITPSTSLSKNIGSDSLQFYKIYASQYYTGSGSGMIFAASTGRYRWYDSDTLSAETLLMELRRSTGLVVDTDVHSTRGVAARGIADLSVGGGGTGGTVTSITAGTGLSGGTITMNGTIALKVAGTTEIGGIQIGFSESNSGSASNRNYAVQLSNNKAFVNVPWTETTDSTVAGWGYKKGMVYTTATASDSSIQVATGANPTYQFVTNTAQSNIAICVTTASAAANTYGVHRYIMIYNNRSSATTIQFADNGEGVVGPADSVSIPAYSYMEFSIIHPASNAKCMVTWSMPLKAIDTL